MLSIIHSLTGNIYYKYFIVLPKISTKNILDIVTPKIFLFGIKVFEPHTKTFILT